MRSLDVFTQRGWNVIPIRRREKAPAAEWAAYHSRLSTPDEHELWWPNGIAGEDPAIGLNIGVVSGAVSNNLVILDFDDGQLGAAFLENVAADIERSCSLVSTGRGSHIYVPVDRDPGPTFIVEHPGFEGVHHIKGNQSQCVAPPSIHPNGSVYTFDVLADIDVPPIPLDGLVLALRTFGFVRKAKRTETGAWPDGFASQKYFEGERNEVLVRIAGALKSGLTGGGIGSQSLAYELLWSWNLQHLDPPLTEHEVRGMVRGLFGRYS